MAVGIIAINEVATACFCDSPSNTMNAGTMTTPPPTPQSAAITPARDPTASDFKMIVGVMEGLEG
jgi:hypothetical protein